MNVGELIAYWRAQIVDEARPYLWSDDEAMAFVNDAQSMFCRLTEGISDATTPEVVNIPVVTGNIYSDAHPKILTFRQASLDSTGVDLPIKNHTVIKKWDNSTGDVRYMVVGMQKDKVRWSNTPVRDDNVTVLVFRLPLDDLTDVEQEFEIESQHLIHLADWMSHLAFKKPDTETFDKQASERAKANFEEYCARVKSEQERYKHTPDTISYGGI